MKLSGKSFSTDIRLSHLLFLFWVKVKGMFIRLIDIFRLLPRRLVRILHHLVLPFRSSRTSRKYWWLPESEVRLFKASALWLINLLVYLLEALGAGELYETATDFAKFNSRPLRAWEKSLARDIFGDSIRYGRVRVDEFAFVGPRQRKFCYVSFYTINSWGPMENGVLLHELTHVWQYEQVGAVYMVKALRAQRSVEGYNYGGVSGIRAFLKKGKDFRSFNLEQQAAIVEDYYRIREGYPPKWGNAGKSDLAVYKEALNVFL